MKLIVGLGNPGEKYKKTRHNAGFKLLDKLILSANESGNTGHETGNKKETELYSVVTCNLSLVTCALAKPQTFMNESGKAVKALVKKYRVKLNELLVIHDDLDIAFGSFKIQMGKGPHQHNGVISVEDYLDSKDFWRMRVGIEARSKIKDQRSKLIGEDYVLAEFSSEEANLFNVLIQLELIPAINNWVRTPSQ